MFGLIRPYMNDLSEEEKARYKAVYCGLCRTLNDKYGLAGRMGLNFDMTFLILLLNSLYEPEEKHREAVCPPHPVKKHGESYSEFTAYAADMTVALTYYKALDDWEDERSRTGKLYADLLKRHYAKVKEQWPAQCAAIEESLDALHDVEKDKAAAPERAADLSGRMLGKIFAVKQDFFQSQMAYLGYALGKFIYMMDAAVDYQDDQKKGCYNPLEGMALTPEDALDILRQPMGQAAEAFEALPLVQDAHLMRNILYSGVWQTYNYEMKKKQSERKEGERDGH
ncbi:MAG: hypothetical protein IJI53_12680 [Clostridia bacterium]|nr:hypothetical protein [Clostridia bacterium]MBR0408888.1 hypothetical protein [Clostridia bacterium]